MGKSVDFHQDRLKWAAISLGRALGERIEAVVEAREDGLTFVQIGEALDITPEAAGNLYRRRKNKTKGAAQ